MIIPFENVQLISGKKIEYTFIWKKMDSGVNLKEYLILGGKWPCEIDNSNGINVW